MDPAAPLTVHEQDAASARPSRGGLLAIIGPGIIVAATGVGAGDLATAGIAGAKLGVGVVWAVIFGGVMKWVLNEGIARWQMATGDTLLAGWTRRLHVQWIFLAYLLLWSFCVGGALMKAVGAAAQALLPLPFEPQISIAIWGAGQSLIAVGLVLLGGYALFERLMAASIGIMFVTVVICAALLAPHIDPGHVHWINPLSLRGDEFTWTLALIGGVGGTVTLLSYGYWIREEGRAGAAGLRICRIDLGVGYGFTTLFGAALIVVAAATPDVAGSGVALLVNLADKIGESLGAWGRIVFLIGAWGAIFSSVLGVWQSVPYMFADFVRLTRRRPECANLAKTGGYRWFLTFIAVAPMALLQFKLEYVVKIYALTGVVFMPLLALSLLVMNTRTSWVGARFRNGWVINTLLALTLVFFAWQGIASLRAS